MQYINTVTREYPLNQERVMSDLRETSFPIGWIEAPEPYAIVTPTECPAFDKSTQQALEIEPELVDGTWYQRWRVIEIFETEEDKQAAAAAAKHAADMNFKQSVTEAVQTRLDDFAKTRMYDGILSACTYANDTDHQFAAEAAYCISVRSQTWATLKIFMGQVERGERPMPTTTHEVMETLPILNWPA